MFHISNTCLRADRDCVLLRPKPGMSHTALVQISQQQQQCASKKTGYHYKTIAYIYRAQRQSPTILMDLIEP